MPILFILERNPASAGFCTRREFVQDKFLNQAADGALPGIDQDILKQESRAAI